MDQVKIKKPSTILFDLAGTVIRESFVEKTLLPYFKMAYRTYLQNEWSKPELQDCLKQLAQSCSKDPGSPVKIVLDSSYSDRMEIIDDISKYIQHCLDNNLQPKSFIMFRFQVWFDGYDSGCLSTPVYSDVPLCLDGWKQQQNFRLYVLSNGWCEANRKFLSKTSHGDLNKIIEDHLDNVMVGSLDRPETYRKVCSEKLQAKPSDVLFLTKMVPEAQAAKKAGLQVILVLTHNSTVEKALQHCQDIPIIRTFKDITFV